MRTLLSAWTYSQCTVILVSEAQQGHDCLTCANRDGTGWYCFSLAPHWCPRNIKKGTPCLWELPWRQSAWSRTEMALWLVVSIWLWSFQRQNRTVCLEGFRRLWWRTCSWCCPEMWNTLSDKGFNNLGGIWPDGGKLPAVSLLVSGIEDIIQESWAAWVLTEVKGSSLLHLATCWFLRARSCTAKADAEAPVQGLLCHIRDRQNDQKKTWVTVSKDWLGRASTQAIWRTHLSEWTQNVRVNELKRYRSMKWQEQNASSLPYVLLSITWWSKMEESSTSCLIRAQQNSC